MGIGFGISHRLSTQIVQKLDHRLAQLQRVELSLKQVLRILQQILQEMRLSQTHLLRLVTELAMVAEQHSVYTMAYVITRHRGVEEARLLAGVLKHVAAEFSSDSRAGDMLTNLSYALKVQAERHKKSNVGLFLKLVLRTPDFFEGRPGTPENLAELLDEVEQVDERGVVMWALAGGWAVEILTGVERPHHDIDAILLNRKLERIDSDYVEPENYFNIISCSARFVRQYCTEIVEWRWLGRTRYLVVLRPEFLFCSKFIRHPRPQDWADVQSLVTAFAKSWDLDLIRRIAMKSRCGFKREQLARLMETLNSRDPQEIIPTLKAFWP